jgi:hypothetical protein
MTLSRGIVVGIGCLGLLAASAGSARAQEVGTSFGDLQKKLKPGATVSVTDSEGKKVKGKLVELSPSSFTLLTGGRRLAFEHDRVQQVARIGRETGKGAGLGLLLGAMGGAVMVLTNCNDCGDYAGAFAFSAAALFGGIGAGVGAAVGHSRTYEEPLYRAPAAATASRFTVTPLISKRGAGLNLALQF